jgi:pRiA4b ORF-3-like protein
MPRGHYLGTTPESPADLIRRLTAEISGGPPQAADLTASKSGRRPRRSDLVRYRVIVDLSGAKPPLWRRLELTSGLFLDEVHEILQAAFGWTDSHLHQFGSGPRYYGPETEYYLCPYQVEEGEPGVPEEEVRLDEVLADPGDTLCYLYDFGDSWEHVIRLEAVAPWDDAVPAAVCLEGRRDGPPEDCGGLGGYELISAAVDPLNPGHGEAVIEFERMYGIEFHADGNGLNPFRIDVLNAELAQRFPPGARPERAEPGDLPGPLAELLGAVRDGYAHRELRWLVGAALAGRSDVDAVTAARMVRPYAWLLDRVGDEGIRLTGAGYLPPAHVEAAATELGLLEDWMGKGNRETQTLPVLHLRETATKMGLLRKLRGMLQLTAAGRKLRTDPVALWWHLAGRMPPRSDRCETQAGLIWLLAVAAERPGDPAEIVARILAGIGWTLADGTPLDTLDADRAAWDTRNVLRRLGGLTDDPRRYGAGSPNEDGVSFARAAVSSWSDAGAPR